MKTIQRLILALAVAFWAAAVTFAQSPNSEGLIFDVRTFGARGDGKTLDTAAISKAIVAANAAGGGVVVFSPGAYLSGTVELLSNVTLEVRAGAVLQASPKTADYGTISAYGFGRNYGVDSSGEGSLVGLIVARKAENISIIGRGRIDGNGDSFFNLKSLHNGPDFDAKYTRQGADYDAPRYGTEFGPADTLPAGRSGTMIILSDCRNVLVRDVTLSNAPNWTLHVQGSENIVIHAIHIQNNVLIPNNDGIDCMGSKHVQISDCDIRTGDDDFAIVSSDDVHVNNCTLFSYSAAIRLEDTRYSTFSNLSIHANRSRCLQPRRGTHGARAVFQHYDGNISDYGALVGQGGTNLHCRPNR
jgi:polygalacturonase